MTKRATMAEVARLANVAPMTVSRVLNNSARVDPKTANRVHTAIEDLDYRPNEIARALRTSKSKSIGLIVPSVMDPFFAVCAHNIHIVAQAHDYAMILTASNDSVSKELSDAEWMLQKNVEGLIICPAATKESGLSNPIFQHMPIMSFDRPLQVPRVINVVVENAEGAKRGTQHLIEHGHKRIHFLGHDPTFFTIKTRFEGYQRAMSSAGLSSHGYLKANSEQMVYEHVKKVLAGKNAPTAFFSANNLISGHVYRAVFRLGLHIPDDIAIVGFDDFEMADLLRPPLTVIRQPVEAIGKTVADALFTRLKMGPDNWPKASSIKTLKVELILRSSCGCNSIAR